MIQFSKIANIYFLITGIMQSIPAISSLQPLAIWAPFIIVIGISMLRIGKSSFILSLLRLSKISPR